MKEGKKKIKVTNDLTDVVDGREDEAWNEWGKNCSSLFSFLGQSILVTIIQIRNPILNQISQARNQHFTNFKTNALLFESSEFVLKPLLPKAESNAELPKTTASCG
ncbi:hypothetical protein LguiB_026355 [Lonicera macranthoides]